jgi:hypothetical protein
MDKVGKVMREFKEGKLKSSSGQKVTNPKQAIAIGISEQKAMKGYKMGGEPKAMMKKEVEFMKAKKAPKSMIKHEMAEMKGMKKGGSVMQSKMGAVKTAAPSINGVAKKGKTKGTMIKMRNGGSC